MAIRKIFFLGIYFVSLHATPLADHFRRTGYVEICEQNDREEFDFLYALFDELIDFLQTNPSWTQKLFCAKERFIRSKEKSYYSTDFFGFYDESKREGRSQISFYYSTHFHEFLYSHYPEFNQVPEILHFFKACLQIQKPYENVFAWAAEKLGLTTLFCSNDGHPPILLKVIKYLPAYIARRPHYDGSAFSLFLDSTDNQSLLLSPYKPSFTAEDFFCPPRTFPNSILLIPGVLLKEFSIDPTPHIAMQTGKIRFATIAFAMRPNYIQPKTELSLLPNILD